MERKTKVTAEKGKQEILITREFDLPLDLLFKAYEDADIIGQWMGTNVLELQNKKYGGYRFETKDGDGNVLFSANGTIHEFVPNEKITRTFEMENAGIGIQLEFLEFERLTDDTSKLTMHTIYRSVADRDQVLEFGMDKGADMAHNQLQKVLSKLKK